jgi:hypothetical protein
MDKAIEGVIQKLKLENPTMDRRLERAIRQLKKDEAKLNVNRAKMKSGNVRKQEQRLRWLAIELLNEYELQYDAAKFHLDRETFALLRVFEESCFVRRYEGDIDGYVDELKKFQSELKEMGRIFRSLGLARRVERSAFAWVPKGNLDEIVYERVSARKFSLEEGHS